MKGRTLFSFRKNVRVNMLLQNALQGILVVYKSTEARQFEILFFFNSARSCKVQEIILQHSIMSYILFAVFFVTGILRDCALAQDTITFGSNAVVSSSMSIRRILNKLEEFKSFLALLAFRKILQFLKTGNFFEI